MLSTFLWYWAIGLYVQWMLLYMPKYAASIANVPRDPGDKFGAVVFGTWLAIVARALIWPIDVAIVVGAFVVGLVRGINERGR